MRTAIAQFKPPKPITLEEARNIFLGTEPMPKRCTRRVGGISCGKSTTPIPQSPTLRHTTSCRTSQVGDAALAFFGRLS